MKQIIVICIALLGRHFLISGIPKSPLCGDFFSTFSSISPWSSEMKDNQSCHLKAEVTSLKTVASYKSIEEEQG